MGNSTEFKHAVQLVIDNVSFDVNSTVQVFETNIRYFSIDNCLAEKLKQNNREICSILCLDE